VDDVVMDEFHWYADRDRGVAWQLPLLALPNTRFLLMSATLGDVAFFAEGLTRLNGWPTAVVKSELRPVPLDYAYSEIALSQTLDKLVSEKKAPVYVVHFTQKEAADSAQDFTSLNLATRDEKNAVAEAIEGFRFSSPYGPVIRKWLKQGIAVHHAGLLPKYRVLVEQLAQKGLLKVICGTDTLGVGINVPIRTVLFTRLCKFDGLKTAVLSARDFHQIAGRAGRKGFDDQGYVVAQAPEHVVENLRLEEKAKDGKKFVRRKPPERNYAHWDLQTFKRLIGAQPEKLASRFQVTHGMLLNVLSRQGDGCRAMQHLIHDSHDPERNKPAHFRRAWQLFRSLVARRIIEIVPAAERSGSKVRVNVELQDDFSMNQTLSLYLLETLHHLEPESETYALDVLTLVESILEDPDLILRKQLDKVKGEAIAAMKAEGLDYDQRMEKLEKLEYPKPLREFVYMTFNAFADAHPWVGEENIRPKSIAREMFEGFRTFPDYVQEYDLERAEGLLLRHLNSVYKVLAQTVPDGIKTGMLLEMELYLRDMIRAVDSSLLEEWDRMRTGVERSALAPAQPAPLDAGPIDVTANAKAFTAAIRARIFAFLKNWSIGQDEAALEVLDAKIDAAGVEWSVDVLKALRDAHRQEHGTLRLDPEARNLKHTSVDTESASGSWRVQQMLVDTQALNDWLTEFDVDLHSSRAAGEPVLQLLRIGSLT
jgi:superfamily II RNA helicase